MEKELKDRIKIEIKYYGIGKVVYFIYNNFFLLRVLLFILGCLFLSIGVKLPFFIFFFIEIAVAWCRFKAPLIDQERREQFKKWVNESIVASGGESCHFANLLFENVYSKMITDTYSDFLCPIASSTLQGLLPFFVKNLNFTAISFGSNPPKLLQAVTEEPPFPNSLSLQIATVLANDISLSCDFTIFRVPFTVVIKDIVLYAPVRVIIESPEHNVFSNTSVITSMAFTAVKPPIVLSANIYLNGFCINRIPMVMYLISIIAEHFISLILANGECIVWDWITNKLSMRHIKRPESALSYQLFHTIADKSKADKDYGRFSFSNDAIERFDETRKMYWERAQKTPLKPNEILLPMSPAHGNETEPVFPFYPERKESREVGIQKFESEGLSQ
ncbi:hypothetical protein GPJ56_001197 [Histomonas meleagridis]|uniref:uncharacterized protein n=1 Tax=Histomonas meleagridis TaxID=135588 RepID=UPI003559A9A4|nr:hypothetical protein GPJ56_001197 [Histomonas meleagridis]KAH0799840.1 hypothetical protein GO595_006952 [Histomonas meleagridis]